MATAEQCAALGMISERDFEDVWGVYQHANGDFFSYEEVVRQPIAHVWTVVETGWEEDRNWYASPGFHIVNKLGYVMTRKPWDPKECRDAVYFLDDITTQEDVDEAFAEDE